MTEATLIIYTSVNGRDPWHPITQDEVPEWVKNHDIMGQLVAGKMCCDSAIGDKGSNWYRAQKVNVLQ